MEEITAEAYLDNYQKTRLHDLIPIIIIIIVIICVLGTVGNSLTIAFYGFVARRSPSILLITVLSSVDLVVCILVLGHISEIVLNVKFTSAAACKIVHFLGHWTIETSILTLWFIAIDRYRHVCCPFKKQITCAMAKRAAIAIIIISLLQSVRDIANFDTVQFPLYVDEDDNSTVILAHYCTTREDQSYKLNVTIWHSLDALIIIIVLVTLCFTYGRIVWVLKTRGNALDTGRNSKQCRVNAARNNTEGTVGQSNKTSTRDDSERVESLPNQPGQRSVENLSNQLCHHSVKSGQQKPPQLDRRSKRKTTERSITLMMLVVSAVFCACFVPYFIVKIGIRSYKGASQLELGTGMQFVLRLPYVNSFANPLVFCCFNPQFRRFIKHTVLGVKPETARCSSTVSATVPS